jgi:hypothetical protein
MVNLKTLDGRLCKYEYHVPSEEERQKMIKAKNMDKLMSGLN